MNGIDMLSKRLVEIGDENKLLKESRDELLKELKHASGYVFGFVDVIKKAEALKEKETNDTTKHRVNQRQGNRV